VSLRCSCKRARTRPSVDAQVRIDAVARGSAMAKYQSPIGDTSDEHMRLVGIIALHWEWVEFFASQLSPARQFNWHCAHSQIELVCFAQWAIRRPSKEKDSEGESL
jgi:hypothetical protein